MMTKQQQQQQQRCFRGDAPHLVDDLIAASQIVPSATYTGFGRELVAATATGFFAADLATATPAATATGSSPPRAAPSPLAKSGGGRRRSSNGQQQQQQQQQPQPPQHAKKQKGPAATSTNNKPQQPPLTSAPPRGPVPSGLSGCLASSASPRPEALPRPQLLARARRPSPPAMSLPPSGVAQGHALMQALRCAA
jgi:hypothetical protein